MVVAAGKAFTRKVMLRSLWLAAALLEVAVCWKKLLKGLAASAKPGGLAEAVLTKIAGECNSNAGLTHVLKSVCAISTCLHIWTFQSGQNSMSLIVLSACQGSLASKQSENAMNLCSDIGSAQ